MERRKKFLKVTPSSKVDVGDVLCKSSPLCIVGGTGEREKEPERAGNDGKENKIVLCPCASYYSIIAISVG